MSPRLRLMPRHRRQASPEMSTNAPSSPSHAPPVFLFEPFAFCPSAAGAATPWPGARQAPWPLKELHRLAESTPPPIPCVKVATPAGPAGRQVQRHGLLLCPTPPLSQLRHAPPLPRASAATSTRPAEPSPERLLVRRHLQPTPPRPSSSVRAAVCPDPAPADRIHPSSCSRRCRSPKLPRRRPASSPCAACQVPCFTRCCLLRFGQAERSPAPLTSRPAACAALSTAPPWPNSRFGLKARCEQLLSVGPASFGPCHVIFPFCEFSIEESIVFPLKSFMMDQIPPQV